MLVEIQDDFDLEKIALSGQCFRVGRLQDGAYRFISGDEVIYIRETGSHTFSVSCSPNAWKDIWSFYFDLGRCYNDVFETECNKHQFIHEAMVYGRGLRILRQNLWNCLHRVLGIVLKPSMKPCILFLRRRKCRMRQKRN